MMRNDPVVVEKFTRGTIKGFLNSRANRTGTIALLARNLKVDEETAAKIYDLGKSALTGDGTVNEATQKKALEFIAKVQGVKDFASSGKIFRFLARAQGYRSAQSTGLETMISSRRNGDPAKIYYGI
jgi:hypothetical protein